MNVCPSDSYVGPPSDMLSEKEEGVAEWAFAYPVKVLKSDLGRTERGEICVEV